VSTVLSLVVAIGYRYAPGRDAMTRSILSSGRSSLTLELVLSIMVAFLSLLSASLVLQPEGYMAVGRGEMWNANLFFSTWTSCSLASYSSGVLPREYGLVMGNTITGRNFRGGTTPWPSSPSRRAAAARIPGA